MTSNLSTRITKLANELEEAEKQAESWSLRVSEIRVQLRAILDSSSTSTAVSGSPRGPRGPYNKRRTDRNHSGSRSGAKRKRGPRAITHPDLVDQRSTPVRVGRVTKPIATLVTRMLRQGSDAVTTAQLLKSDYKLILPTVQIRKIGEKAGLDVKNSASSGTNS